MARAGPQNRIAQGQTACTTSSATTLGSSRWGGGEGGITDRVKETTIARSGVEVQDSGSCMGLRVGRRLSCLVDIAIHALAWLRTRALLDCRTAVHAVQASWCGLPRRQRYHSSPRSMRCFTRGLGTGWALPIDECRVNSRNRNGMPNARWVTVTIVSCPVVAW